MSEVPWWVMLLPVLAFFAGTFVAWIQDTFPRKFDPTATTITVGKNLKLEPGDVIHIKRTNERYVVKEKK
ncbi:MAG: hypothetical protein ACYS7Y_31045 [Planctomycetota bacterium]|jgi:hypothetical protein